MKRKFFVIIMILCAGTASFAQKDNKLVRQGNRDYANEDYNAAETDFIKALEANPNSAKAHYNLGATRYRQENQAEAINNWTATALNATNDAEMRANSFYNIGNAYLTGNDYQKSIEAYKQALRLNPDDEDARYNLEYARQKLAQQQQDQQQQGGGDNQQQDKNQQEQDQKDQEQQQDQQQQQQQQNQQDQQQQQQQQQQAQQQEISQEEAERMLEAMKNNEKKTLEKMQKVQAKPKKGSDKDW